MNRESGDTGASTIKTLRDLLGPLPTTAAVIIEDRWGAKYAVRRAFVIGAATDDLGLVLKIEQVVEP